MERPGDNAHATTRARRYRSPEEARARKEQVLTQGKPSITRGIADALVAKVGDVFFLSDPDGQVPLDERHGLGLYYHDCRFLDGYSFRLADTVPNLLVATATQGFMNELEFANPEIRRGGDVVLEGETLGIRWTRVVDGDRRALRDRFTFRNFSQRPVDLPVSFRFRAEFADLYAVRGLLPERAGTLRDPAWREDRLVFAYDGADGIRRTTTVGFSRPPEDRHGPRTSFRLAIEGRETSSLEITVAVDEIPMHADARTIIGRPDGPHAGTLVRPRNRRGAGAEPRGPTPERVSHEAHEPADHPKLGVLISSLERSVDRSVREATAIQSDSAVLNRAIDRSLRDLRILRSRLRDLRFHAAGLPWFVTLFGRDAIIAALQTLAYAPGIAEETLRLLASFQGTRVDDWRDEQPGKILHELRAGEFAHLDEIPHTPYYGTVDATPLFLILLARHAAWTGDLSLFRELRPNVERALAWIDEYGDLDGDGFVEYRSESRRGLVNQGWKDSGDAIVNADGSLARPPIALVEVQGYIYAARQAVAELFDHAGDGDRARALRRDADALRGRFEDTFWLEDRGFYALALQEDDSPARVASSNAGHALWAGIAGAERARRTARRLMADDMFTGWGVRTLSADEACYNPIGYHLGTVWPHDNAIIAAGLRRYGFDDEATRIFGGLLDAASYFEHFRLPEAFAGFRRGDFPVPVNYPVACHPQAWAAGSVAYLVATMLGLRPDAFERNLHVVRPILPELVDRLEVRGLRVGPATVDLCFTRTPTGTAVQTLDVDGEMGVIVEHDGVR